MDGADSLTVLALSIEYVGKSVVLTAEAIMSRKSDSHASNNRSAAALKSLRSQVDKLDLQILKMVNERASVAGEIVKLKKTKGGTSLIPLGKRRSFRI